MKKQEMHTQKQLVSITPEPITLKNKAFYETLSSDWRYQCYENQKVWLHRCIVALIATFVGLLLSLTLFLLLYPLKEKVPYVLSINTTTGELTQIGVLQASKLQSDWMLTRYLLIRYITARESYDSDNLEQPYQVTYAMSEKELAAQYAIEVNSENPSSPFQRYGKNQFVTVHITSISKLNDNTASIHFEQQLHDRTSQTIKKMPKEAIVRWHYTNVVMMQTMLDRDPLGFKVTYYQVTPVTLDQPEG